MNVSALLDGMHRRGVRLHINGDKLRWRAPVGVMTDADLSALRHSKPEVLAIIREQDADRIEERASIIEFDVYLSRREAERRAGNEQHPDTAA
jgi:transcriptional regulator